MGVVVWGRCHAFVAADGNTAAAARLLGVLDFRETNILPRLQTKVFEACLDYL